MKAILGSFLLVALSFASGQSSGRQASLGSSDMVRAALPSWAKTPTDTTTVAGSTNDSAGVDDTLRKARSDAFNGRIGLQPKLETLSATGASGKKMFNGIGAAYDHGYLPPLPVDRAATIVVGKVLSAQGYFSSDHTSIYTELPVAVEQVLQDTTATIRPKSQLYVLESGGSVSLKGEVVGYPVDSNKDLIDIDNRYLLFLYFRPASQSFGVVRAWQLLGNHPVRMGTYRPNDKEDIVPYVAMTEAEFIAHVEGSIASHSTH